MKRQSDWAHLLRMALLFAATILAFVVIRPMFVPESFGQYGHYRGDAILEAREAPLHFAGRAECATCHSDVVDLQVKEQSKHSRIGCESCHGAQAAHAASADTVKPPRPDATTLCASCHAQLAGRRPSAVPQVEITDHSGGEVCTTCHVPHAPGVS